MELQGTTELFVQYLEYVAATQRNGVFPPYGYATWIRCRTQF
jgi:hypothetical protein